MFTEREFLILSFAISELIKNRPAAFFTHTDADKLLDKVHMKLQRHREDNAGDPSLMRAAKAQWAREAKERQPKPPICPNCNGEMEASGDCFFCGYSQPVKRV